MLQKNTTLIASAADKPPITLCKATQFLHLQITTPLQSSALHDVGKRDAQLSSDHTSKSIGQASKILKSHVSFSSSITRIALFTQNLAQILEG